MTGCTRAVETVGKSCNVDDEAVSGLGKTASAQILYAVKYSRNCSVRFKDAFLLTQNQAVSIGTIRGIRYKYQRELSNS